MNSNEINRASVPGEYQQSSGHLTLHIILVLMDMICRESARVSLSFRVDFNVLCIAKIIPFRESTFQTDCRVESDDSHGISHESQLSMITALE